MKNKVINFLVLSFLVILMTGCNSKSNSINYIEETKVEINSIISDIIDTSPSNISQTSFYDSFLVSSYDLQLKIEEKYNNGDKIYLNFDFEGEEINGKKIGADENNTRKYYIYIGNETYEDLWSYGIVDLKEGTISWEDSY